MLTTGSPLVTMGNIFESKLVKLKDSTTINLENYTIYKRKPISSRLSTSLLEKKNINDSNRIGTLLRTLQVHTRTSASTFSITYRAA